MKKQLILLTIALSMIFVSLMSCESSKNSTTPATSTVITPNLTSSQAMGIVSAAIKASTPTVRASAGWYSAKFNQSNRQWLVTTWSSEEASKEYIGSVYVVDDATGKLLNPPPVYNPSSK